MKCPACESADVINASLFCEMETGATDSSTVITGMGGGGLAFAETAASSSSELVERLRPEQDSIAPALSMGFAVLALIYCSATWPPLWVWLVLPLGGILAALPFALSAMNKEAEQRATLEKQWLCKRCGHLEDANAFRDNA